MLKTNTVSIGILQCIMVLPVSRQKSSLRDLFRPKNIQDPRPQPQTAWRLAVALGWSCCASSSWMLWNQFWWLGHGWLVQKWRWPISLHQGNDFLNPTPQGTQIKLDFFWCTNPFVFGGLRLGVSIILTNTSTNINYIIMVHRSFPSYIRNVTSAEMWYTVFIYICCR